jgi:fructokinase
MNLRMGQWNLPLVQRLCRAATVLKLNEDEAEALFRMVQPSADFTLETFCMDWAAEFELNTICVTLGRRGCGVFTAGRFEIFPGYPVTVADTVGAGDAFAAAFLHAIESGWTLERAASFANGLGALVASRNGAIPAWTTDELMALTSAEQNA